MSAEKVLKGIEFLTEHHNLDAINFTADNFFVDKQRVLKICTGLIERNLDIAWHADMRIDTFLHYEDDVLDLMKRSGCTELTFGVESGSDRILTLIDKDIRVCDVLEAHSKAKRFGFRINYHFMVGFPEETRSDITETVKLIHLLLTTYEHASTFGPSIYIPYPGTPLFERSIEMGFKPPHTLEGWITYDWQQTPAFPWFSNWDKRYLKEVQTVSMMAKTSPSSLSGRILRKYGLLRLLGISRGIHLFDLDTSLARLFKYGRKRKKIE
jgi:anaerobic magnesium-protoporphyrin IX monomethyl ester cyclase